MPHRLRSEKNPRYRRKEKPGGRPAADVSLIYILTISLTDLMGNMLIQIQHITQQLHYYNGICKSVSVIFRSDFVLLLLLLRLSQRKPERENRKEREREKNMEIFSRDYHREDEEEEARTSPRQRHNSKKRVEPKSSRFSLLLLRLFIIAIVLFFSPSLQPQRSVRQHQFINILGRDKYHRSSANQIRLRSYLSNARRWLRFSRRERAATRGD